MSKRQVKTLIILIYAILVFCCGFYKAPHKIYSTNEYGYELGEVYQANYPVWYSVQNYIHSTNDPVAIAALSQASYITPVMFKHEIDYSLLLTEIILITIVGLGAFATAGGTLIKVFNKYINNYSKS